MTQKTKDRLKRVGMVSAPIAAGVGTYLLSRTPFKSLSKRVYGKHLEPAYVAKKFVKTKKGDNAPMPKLHGFTRIISKKENLKSQMAALKKMKPGKHLNMGIMSEDYIKTPTRKGLHETTMIKDPHAKTILDKEEYGKKLHGLGMGAKTHVLSPELAEKLRSNPQRYAHTLKKHLGGDFFIKPKKEFSDLETSLGAGEYITPKTKWNEDKVIRFLDKPHQYVIQDKLPIKKEYRVTVLDGKILNILPRYNYNHWRYGGSGKMLNWKLHKQMEPLVKKHYKTMLPKDKITPMSMDIALTHQSGKPKLHIIESNLGVSGGQLEHPAIARKVYKEISGRETKPVAALKGVGAAGLTGLIEKKVSDHGKKEKRR